MRVLVTGANGYLGRAVVEALHSAGHEPVAMVRAHGLVIPGAADVRVADLLDDKAVRDAVERVDAICHLAGLARARESVDEPLRYFRVNTSGTLSVLEAMIDAGIRGIVFASTGAIYGTPDVQPMTEDIGDAPPHPYAGSKLAAELAIEAAAGSGELAAVIVRLSNIAGGADGDPSRLISRALAAASERSALIVNGDGTAVRDYLHIMDAARALVACIEHLPPVGTATRYNIGSGRGTSVLDVVAAVERVTGRPVALEHRSAAAEPAVLINDPTKAMTEIGWKPTHSDIDDIVRDESRALLEES